MQLNLKELYIGIRTYFIRRKAIKDQRKRALYMIEIDKLFEGWLTFAILNKQISDAEINAPNGANKQLMDRRASIKNQENFLDFLSTIK